MPVASPDEGAYMYEDDAASEPALHLTLRYSRLFNHWCFHACLCPMPVSVCDGLVMQLRGFFLYELLCPSVRHEAQADGRLLIQDSSTKHSTLLQF